MNPFGRTFLRSGAAFGVLLAMPFALLGLIVFGWEIGGLAFLAIALVAGVPFGLMMAAFARSKSVRRDTQPNLEEGEKVLKEGPANHFMGFEGVGGRLFLTDRRLLFKSHRWNFQVHELSVPLAEVAGAKAVMTAGILPNGLKVSRADGTTDRFVVEGRGEWERLIRDAVATSSVGCNAGG
jgi:hypothetical protein